MPEVQVGSVREGDSRELRDIRLRALADSPDAFGSTLEREQAFNDSDWQQWARDSAAGATETCFLAWVDEEPVGIVGGYIEVGRDQVHLVAMWIDPQARRLGIGRTLIDAVVAWAVEIGASAIRLDVAVDNAGAHRLYETSSFAPTGCTKQYEDRPQLTTLELERRLSTEAG
ncbi:MAG: GNAT family N-acetyltransferase [Gaiellaceae bacterium]